MSDWYVIDQRGHRVGPISPDRVAQMIVAGDLNAQSLAWNESLGDNWKLLEETEFLDLLRKQPPPLKPATPPHVPERNSEREATLEAYKRQAHLPRKEPSFEPYDKTNQFADQKRAAAREAPSDRAAGAQTIPSGAVLAGIFLIGMLLFAGHWQAEQTLRKDVENLINRDQNGAGRVIVQKVIAPFFIGFGGRSVVDALVEGGASSPTRIEVIVLGSPIFGEYFVEIDGLEMLKIR